MQRKLTAILSADVVGYSGLMEADETGTVERLKANRSAVFDPHVASHGGRVFKLMGDGALVEFSSVIAAVNCALAIQEATENVGTETSEGKRIRYRIGINLGEVIVEGDDIYGEGVNVAARLQALAPVGGVALSRVVRDQVEGKAPCAFEDMGEHTVKNIERPVHVFSVRAAAGRSKAVEDKAEHLRKLSICVLPFANMSGDPEQEYFSDGISEDIITDLSKISALHVVSRNTAFTFKGKAVDVGQVASQLKVTHVVEGSVRKAAGRVRITAQLIDGANDSHLWAERYDRHLNDIFAIQDEISHAIVDALKVKLLPEEKKAIEQHGTENVEAYNLFLMARQTFDTGFEGDARRLDAIIRMCRRAVEIDSNYADAWVMIALAEVLLRASVGRQGGDSGLAAVERSLALNPDLAEAHAVKARILAEEDRYDEADREINIALRLNPESHQVNRFAGVLRFRQKQIEEAAAYWEKALTLEENDFGSAGMLITVYTALGKPEAAERAAKIALERCEKILARDSNNAAALGHSGVALAILGQRERAKEWMERALLVDPDNLTMRYNFVCALANYLSDKDAALEILRPTFEQMGGRGIINHAKVDPDLDNIREDQRFKEMLAAAETRLAEDQTGSATNESNSNTC
jgi:adenylate cyclase